MKWRNSKERELLASGGSRDQTLPNKNNPNPDLSDARGDRPPSISPASSPNDNHMQSNQLQGTSQIASNHQINVSIIAPLLHDFITNILNFFCNSLVLFSYRTLNKNTEIIYIQCQMLGQMNLNIILMNQIDTDN